MTGLFQFTYSFVYVLLITVYGYCRIKRKILDPFLILLIGSFLIIYIFPSSGCLLSYTKYTLSLQRELKASLIFLLVTVASKLYMQSCARKYMLPGPRPLPLFGNAHLLAGDPSKLLSKVSGLLDKYNGLMALWIGPKLHVFVSEPEHLETFCTHPKLQDKSEHYRFVKPLLGESIFTTNGAAWKKVRKLMLPFLRPEYLNNMLPGFNSHTRALVTRMRNEEGKNSFDVFPYLRDASYCMVFEPVMGMNVSLASSLGFLQDADELMSLIYQRAITLWLQWNPLYFLTHDAKRFQNCVERVRTYNTQNVLKSMRRLQDSPTREIKEGQILVEHLLKKIGTDECKIQIVTEHIQTMLVTGYSMAGTMGFLLMMLGIHQDIQQNVYEEILHLNSHTNNINADDLSKCQYLERVIKETLRLFPIALIIFREASDNVKIGNVIVPKGASVGCVMFCTHRNSVIFPDPLMFNPDNFLPERVAQRHPYAYLPFSSGSRGCIGRKYGMMSMKVVLSQLIFKYKIFCDTKMEEIRLKPELTLKIEGGFKIRIEKRTS